MTCGVHGQSGRLLLVSVTWLGAGHWVPSVLPHPFPSTCTDFRERKRENREWERERGRWQGESKQGEAEVHGAGVAREGGGPGHDKPAGAVYGGGAWRARGRERSGEAEQGRQRCLLRHGGARRGRGDSIFRPSLLSARSSKGEEGRAELGEKGRAEDRCGAEGEGGSRGAARFGSSAQGGGFTAAREAA